MLQPSWTPWTAGNKAEAASNKAKAEAKAAGNRAANDRPSSLRTPDARLLQQGTYPGGLHELLGPS